MNIGDKAPEVLGINEKGVEIRLSDYKGKKIVLYFYPKDMTSGCTAQACNLRDNYADLRKAGYEVIGVSVDSEKSHQKFIEKNNLPFTLIADTDKKLVEQFGVWGEKSMYGRKYMGTFRTTFIINEEGIVERIITPKEVKTKDHAAQILYSLNINNVAKKDELNFENGSNLASGEKLKALQAAMDKIEKSFGKGSIMKMGDESVEQVEVIPTGSIGLNVALGVGGYPRGRIIEIYGPESSGKTTLAIHAIAEAQKAGGIAAFIDAEHAFDRFYAAKLGVDVDNLLISQPDNGEQALEIAEQLIRSSAIDIIVVDSVAALTPKAEIEGDMGDNKVGLQARLMSQALRKLTAAVSKTRTTCIFINQLREKIGVMFGNPETTTGGNALKFYASVRLDIRGSQAIKNGDEVIGKQTKVKVVKNKVAPPFRRAEFDIMFGEGISRAGEIIDLGAELGIIKKSGSWFSYNETKIAQGRDAAKQVILDNPELAEELEGLIFAELRKDK